jgi:cell division protein FtsL
MEYLTKLFQRNKKNARGCNTKVYALNIFLGILMCLCVAGYFVQVNTMVYKGYALRDGEQQISELQEVHQQLQLEVVDLRSIQSITERAEEMGLVNSIGSEYVTVSGALVAQR